MPMKIKDLPEVTELGALLKVITDAAEGRRAGYQWKDACVRFIVTTHGEGDIIHIPIPMDDAESYIGRERARLEARLCELGVEP